MVGPWHQTRRAQARKSCAALYLSLPPPPVAAHRIPSLPSRGACPSPDVAECLRLCLYSTCRRCLAAIALGCIPQCPAAVGALVCVACGGLGYHVGAYLLFFHGVPGACELHGASGDLVGTSRVAGSRSARRQLWRGAAVWHLRALQAGEPMPIQINYDGAPASFAWYHAFASVASFIRMRVLMQSRRTEQPTSYASCGASLQPTMHWMNGGMGWRQLTLNSRQTERCVLCRLGALAAVRSGSNARRAAVAKTALESRLASSGALLSRRIE
jgi:hypothetical protein